MFRESILNERLKKFYSSIKQGNGLPLTAEDIQEREDLQRIKLQKLVEYLTKGSGILEANYLKSARTINLAESWIVIDGDILVISHDGDVADFDIKNIYDTLNVTTFSIGIIGWYEPVVSSSTMYKYGGLRNSTTVNDLIDQNLNIQVSSRYIFKWMPAIYYNSSVRPLLTFTANNSKKETTKSSDSIPNKTISISTMEEGLGKFYLNGNIYTPDTAQGEYGYYLSLADIQVTVSSNQFSSYQMYEYDPLNLGGGGTSWIPSTTEPDNPDEGLIWYNPNNGKVKIGTGDEFISISSELAYIQYTQKLILNANVSSATFTGDSNLRNDTLSFFYNGVKMETPANYTLTFRNVGDLYYVDVNFIGFTAEADDELVLIDHRLVEMSSAQSLATDFATHKSQVASGSSSSHVLLSDSANANRGISSGYAATPKSVYDATTFTDTVTGYKYRIQVTNGNLTPVRVS